MIGAAEQTAVGVIIRGCPDPEGQALVAPVLWTNREIGAISAPTGNLVGCNIRGRIVGGDRGIDGFVQQVSLHELIGQGTEMKIRLTDKPSTSVRRDLGQLFAPDPALIATSSWLVKTSRAYLGMGVTTFDLVGTTPFNGMIFWIENEALRVDSFVTLAVGVHEVNVTRGVLGSRDREHVIKPSEYNSGDGREVGLIAFNRPDFDRYQFETEVYFFTMDGNTASVAEFWPRMTNGRPIPEGVGIEWAISTLDVLGWAQKKRAKRGPVSLSHAVTIKSTDPGILRELPVAVPPGFSSGPRTTPPCAIVAWTTIYEAEKFFDRRFRLPFSNAPSEFDVSDYNSRLNGYPTLERRRAVPEIVLTNGGYEWTYRITELRLETGPVWNTEMGLVYIGIYATLWSALQEDGTCGNQYDSPVPGYPGVQQFRQGTPAPVMLEPKRPPSLNMGWSFLDHDPIRVKLGESAPKIRLRVWLQKMRPVEQLQTLLLSGQGGGQNDSDYDILMHNLCPEIDPTWLNRGAGSGSPITIDPRTKQLLQLDQLLRTQETVPIELSDFDLGQHLRRIARAASIVASYVAEGLTFRQVSATSQPSITALKQVTGAGRLVNTGTRSRAIKGIQIRGGHHPISLKPGWIQPVFLFDAGDPEEGEQVDVYPEGGALSPEEWFSGSMSTLVRVTFLMTRGSPPTYEVPTKRPRGAIYVGDAVSWVDDSIVGPNGRGQLPNRFGRWVCVGRKIVPHSGDQMVTLMTDQLAEIVSSTAFLGAAWLVTRFSEIESAVQFTFVTAKDSAAELDPLDALAGTLANNNWVRFISTEEHNVQTGNEFTRPGAMEVYAQILNMTIYLDVGESAYGVATLSPIFRLDGTSPTGIVERRTWMMIADHMPRQQNSPGQEIVPVEQVDGRGIVIAPGDGNVQTSKPYAGEVYLFDA